MGGFFALGSAYAVSAGLLVWAVESGYLDPVGWVEGWIILGAVLAVVAAFRAGRPD
ncbi:MAG: hypothetical protein R3324_14205 [Halobacteriales archaeon]|nr:hypothetical protein [Halobacteriales archaeon]